MVKIADIKPNPDNPRFIRDEKFNKLKSSIEQFPKMMALRPIVVDDAGTVLGGNMRLRALQELGYTEVPGEWVKRADELTEEEKRRFIITDNAGFGQWDWDVLANEWNAEELTDWGLDVPEEWGEEELEADEDDYTEPENIRVDVVPGDLIEIGRHRLLCGSCVESDKVELLFGESSIDLILTDPPYCSGGFQEAQRGQGSIGSDAKHKWGAEGPVIANDRLSTRGWAALLKSAFALSRSHAIYCFTDWRMWVHLFDLAESSGFQVRSMIVWDKGTPGMGIGWRAQHELILYGTRTKIKFCKHKAAIGNVISCQRSGNPNHPTQKPVELISEIMGVSYWANSIYDPFLGSGTTMVAAHQLNRTCYGMEIDPKYCQVVIDRMRKLDPALGVKINGKKYEPKQEEETPM